MILLYADDPGAVNYLAPLPQALAKRGVLSHFVVDATLQNYVRDRCMAAKIRASDALPVAMLQGVDLLVAGSSENRECFGIRLIDAARAAAIPCVGAVDMEVNAAHRFMGEGCDPLRHFPDYLMVPDPSCAKAYEALGVRPDRIVVCGHPHYDVVRAHRQAFEREDTAALRSRFFPEAPSKSPVWLFVAEGVDLLNPVVSFRSADYTLHGRGGSRFRACIVLEEVVDVAKSLCPRPWIVLRLHPKNSIKDFASVLPDVSQISQGGDPLPLVWAADLIVGMTSMLLLEACLLGKSHVSVLPRASETAWLVTLANGVTPVAVDREGVRSLLHKVPQAGDVPTRILADGAVSRIVDFLLNLLNRRVRL